MKSMSYSKKIALTVLLFIMIPSVIFFCFILNSQVNKINFQYESEVYKSVDIVQKKITELSNNIFQKARVISSYSRLSEILRTKEPIEISSTMMEDKNEIEDVIDMIFADNPSVKMTIHTTNKNAAIFGFIEYIDDPQMINDISNNTLVGQWRYELVNGERMLSYFKKYYLNDIINIIEINIPIGLVINSLGDFGIEDTYIKVSGNGEDLYYLVYEGNSFVECELPQSDYRIVNSLISEIGLGIDAYIDKDTIEREVLRFILLILLFFAVFCVIIYFASIYIVGNYTKEIKVIVDDIKDNKIFDDEKINENNEIDLIKGYIFDLKNKFENESRERLTFESNMLLLRLSPHFLYNNLSALRRYCQSDIAKNAIDKFIRYYRNVFQKGTYTTSLVKEVENGVEYLEILKFTYRKEFDIVCEIDDECKQIQIPSNILQPVLENSFIHGINDIIGEQKGCITIISYIDEKNDVILKICDNAGRFNKEKYIEINNQTEQKHALNIIKKRMRLHYIDDKYTVSIDGDENKTVVTFRFSKEVDKC